MDIRDLHYFEVIATVGNVGRAAERIGRSQPALSKAIDRLEAELGAALFTHVGRGLQLTKAGEMLLEEAVSIRLQMETASRRLAQHIQGTNEHVRLGAGPAAAEQFVPHVLPVLLNRRSDITVSVTTGNSDTLRRMLRAQQLDIVVGSISEHDIVEFRSVLLAHDQMVPVGRIDHPLAARSLVPEDLVQQRWLLPYRPAPGREWLEAAFRLRDLPPLVVQVETNSVPLLSHVVETTDILTFMSRRELLQLPKLRELEVEGLTMPRDMGVVYRTDGPLPDATERFVALLRKNTTSLRGGSNES